MVTYNHYPYPSYAYAEMHPDRLAMVARLFGLTPASLHTCRILEIGCGRGGHLLPIAEAFPQAKLVGIDPSEDAIAEAQAHAEALGADNLTFRVQGAEDLDPERDGPFDYILCHGVWSWVPELIRDAILRACTRTLAPDGIIAISYNVLPGWHEAGALRALLRFAIDPDASPEAQVIAARQQLDLLVRTTEETGDTRHAFLAAEARRLSASPNAYLYYEYLADENTPEWFQDFVRKASRYDLRYLGNGDLQTMWVPGQPEPVAQAMSACSNIIEAQQTLDLLRNCRFRTTFLCRAHHAPNMNLTPERLWPLAFRANFIGDPATSAPLDETTFVRIARPDGLTADVCGVALRSALSALLGAAPRALDWNILRALIDDPESHGPVAEGLMRLAFSGFIYLHTHTPTIAHTLSDRPTASRTARLLAAQQNILANQWHVARPLTEPQRQALMLLDGEHTTEDLLDRFGSAVLDTLEVLRENAYLIA